MLIWKRRLTILLTFASLAMFDGCYQSAALKPYELRHRRVDGPPSVLRVRPFRRPSASSLWNPRTKSHQWTSIVLHHTASEHGDVESIHQSHLKRKDSSGNNWLGIGYHFVIGNGHGMNDGEIQPTFRWHSQLHGAHAGHREHNRQGIGIALVGNFEKHPPTQAQLQALKSLLDFLTRKYGIDSKNILSHSEIKSTACPGKFFPMKRIRSSLRISRPSDQTHWEIFIP